MVGELRRPVPGYLAGIALPSIVFGIGQGLGLSNAHHTGGALGLGILVTIFAAAGSGADGARSAWPPAIKDTTMQITRNSLDTNQGPSDWFTGTVYIDTIAAPAGSTRTGAALVHFTPSARTAWHTHPYGQTICVTEGIGRCQREGGPIEEIRPGDRVYFEPGENHWHGAAPNRFMTHIAIQEADENGSPVTWGEHVTDEQYNAAPAS